MERPEPAELKVQAERERKRLVDVRERAKKTQDSGAQSALQRVDGERMVHEVDTALAASQDDPDAADKCKNRLLDLKQAVDDAEDALEWPTVLAAAEQEIGFANEIAQQYGKPNEKQAVTTLAREVRETIQTHDADLLRRKVEELRSVKFQILREQPAWWVGLLENLDKNDRPRMRDGHQADALFNMGRRAIQTGDVRGLQSAVRQLFALLPQEQQAAAGVGSTVMLG